MIRSATPEDVGLLMSLVERLESELPPLPYPEDPAEFEIAKVEKMVREGVALIAEEEGTPVGYLLARFGDHGPTTLYVTDLWVAAVARGKGLGRELLLRAGELGKERSSTHLVLDVDSKNTDAIAFYERLGFEEGAKILRVEIGTIRGSEAHAESTGAVHVQTDDPDAVQRVLDQYLPRLARGSTAEVAASRTWTKVTLAPFSLDVLRKLGQELSYRFGVSVVLTLEEDAVVRFVIHDQGRMVDEYLSQPHYYGELPPGDALALRANPTVVARLTGADAARVRAVARTEDTPPAPQLYAQIAELLGLEP